MGEVTFLTLGDIECDPVALLERLETGGVDARVMDEHVRSVFLLDKTVALAVIKPFYHALCHSNSSFQQKFSWSRATRRKIGPRLVAQDAARIQDGRFKQSKYSLKR
jgi:hypothetical protein